MDSKLNILEFNQYYIAKEIKDSNNKPYKENQQEIHEDKTQIYDFNWEKYMRICREVEL